MRFLLDTNILIYAANPSGKEYGRTRKYLDDRFGEHTPWYLTWGIIHEFFRVVTHPRIFPKPMTHAKAYGFIGDLLTRDEVTILLATSRHWEMLERTLGELSQPQGNFFHDIETAVLLREHGVPEIITADTDFLQFRFLKVLNPLTL